MRVELSLRAAEDLVRKNTFAAREVYHQHGGIICRFLFAACKS